jgi:hypothetical protein
MTENNQSHEQLRIGHPCLLVSLCARFPHPRNEHLLQDYFHLGGKRGPEMKECMNTLKFSLA